jgi:hypothetical protein
MIEPASESNEIQGDNVPQGQGKTSPTQRRPIKSGGGTAAKDIEAQEELRAYQRWLSRPGEKQRNFRCDVLTEGVAKGLMPNLNYSCIEFAKAGGSAPKASGPDGSSTLSWSPYTHPSSPQHSTEA